MKIEFENGSKWSVSTASNNPMEGSTLTLEKLLEIMYEYFPKLYYGTNENIKRGTAYLVKESKLFPEFIIINPEDFDAVQFSTGRTLIHLKNYKPQFKPFLIEDQEE